MRARAGPALATVSAAAALVGALAGAWYTAPRLGDWRSTYGELDARIADDPVAVFLGFDEGTWEALAGMLGRGDRYAVVVIGERRHEIANYAAYRLLPAVQVVRPLEADVIVYYAPAAAPERCVRVGVDACIVRRERP